MNPSALVLLFLIGMALGVIVHRASFCVFGALVEWFEGAGTRRLKGVMAAVAVFALIHFWGFGGNPPCAGSWGEYAGLHTFIGGAIQGVGYVLLAGCPLSLCVRIGQGNLFRWYRLMERILRERQTAKVSRDFGVTFDQRFSLGEEGVLCWEWVLKVEGSGRDADECRTALDEGIAFLTKLFRQE